MWRWRWETHEHFFRFIIIRLTWMPKTVCEMQWKMRFASETADFDRMCLLAA